MNRRLIAALCCGLLVLSGCALHLSGPAGGEQRFLTVYRLTRDMAGGELIGQELCPIPEDTASEVRAAVELFAAPSETEELACALPDGVRLENWTVENGAVTLELSEEFLEAAPMARTTAAFCAALTLCALEDVASVNVMAGGRTLFSGLVPADALLRDTDTDPFVRQLRLYFTDRSGRYLSSEYHSLTLAEDAAADRYVMEELLRGPNSAELQSAIPEGTELLACRTENGVCTVDLSAAFYSGRPETALGERLALYSIVNSLTGLAQVDSVRILVEGEPVERYVYRSLTQPLVRYERAVAPEASGRDERDVDLFLPLPGLNDVAPLPWRVSAADDPALPAAVLNALLTAAEPGYPAVFPGGGTAESVTTADGVCTAALPEDFFAALPAEARSVAVRSMAATLCALDGVDRVRFTLDGGPAVFDGTDWSGPWKGSDWADDSRLSPAFAPGA